MSGCPVCGKPLRKFIRHHFHHPKHDWQKSHPDEINPLIKVHSKCEKAYHYFYDHHCEGKGCNYRPCPYQKICCYCK